MKRCEVAYSECADSTDYLSFAAEKMLRRDFENASEMHTTPAKSLTFCEMFKETKAEEVPASIRKRRRRTYSIGRGTSPRDDGSVGSQNQTITTGGIAIEATLTDSRGA